METTITRYQTYSGTIAAGDTFPIHRAGRSITCFAASDDLEIIIDDGSKSYFTAGIAMEFDQPFEKVQLRNPNGVAVTFTVATAMGKVDDNRLTVSAPLEISGYSATPKFKLDGTTDAGFTIENIAWYLAENNGNQASLLAAKHKVGSSQVFGTFAGAVVTVVDPTLNLNGAIVRNGGMFPGGAVTATVFVDTAAPSGPLDFTKRAIVRASAGGGEFVPFPQLPMRLSAGVGLFAAPSGSGGEYMFDWDYL